MSKAVMISIQPKWCELIASGRKTIEVRKTRPKLDTPFKCYIYCTKNNGYMYRCRFDENRLAIPELWNGKVIGEFICDSIDEFIVFENGMVQYWNYHDLKKSCLTYEQIAEYIGNCKKGCAWHITGLKIYDTSRELAEFSVECKAGYRKCNACTALGFNRDNCILSDGKFIKPLKQAPQSWCYVEEE